MTVGAGVWSSAARERMERMKLTCQCATQPGVKLVVSVGRKPCDDISVPLCERCNLIVTERRPGPVDLAAETLSVAMRQLRELRDAQAADRSRIASRLEQLEAPSVPGGSPAPSRGPRGLRLVPPPD